MSRKRAFENPAITSLRAGQYQAFLAFARYHQQLGNTGEAARSFRAAREVLENIPRETPDHLYELATVYAALAHPSEAAIEPTEEETAEQERNIELTLQTLRQAVEAGFNNVQKLKADRSFDVLRERPEFEQLVTALDKAAEAQQLASRSAASTEQRLSDQQKAAALLTDAVVDHPGVLRHRATLAATLHSIGVIQTGLKQFDEAEKSLNEALLLRQALRIDQPQDPLISIDEAATRVALGQLHWERARFPVGHETWQQCSDDLQTIAEAHRDNQALQQRIASEERRICNGYGRYGLWPLAGPFARRGAEFRRVGNNFQDAEFSALLLLPENAAAADKYLAALAAAPPLTDADRETFRIANLVRTAALARSEKIAPEDLIERARKALAAHKDGDDWWKCLLPMALYRAGKFQEARDLLAQVGETGSFAFIRAQSPYVKSIIASALGNDSEARSHLARGEELYKQACLESLSHPAANSLGLPTTNWHELIQLQAQRREALRLIHGEVPPDPWQHLIQARGYRLIGEIEKSDAELAAAEAAASDDADVWMARARLFDQWDRHELADGQALEEAVRLARAGNDPLPLIHAGRQYAERGEHDTADALFAEAAARTPDELNRFLEAGWWVVGPYPPNLDEFCPAEIDPDPSKPVHVIDPQTGISDEAVAWRHVAGGTLGELSGRTDASAYALTYVYSPDERTALMRVGGSKPIRIWCNNQLVFTTDEPRDGGIHGTRVPVALHAGRNVLLLKTSGDPPSVVRLGDSPLDRALTYAEAGLWQEAADLTASHGPDFTANNHAWLHHVPILALTGREDAYRKQLAAQYDRSFSNSNDGTLTYLAAAMTAMSNPVLSEHYDEFLARVESVLTREGNRYNRFENGTFSAAWGALLLDRVPDAQRLVDRIDRGLGKEAAGWYRDGWPVRALLAEKAGKHDESLHWLDRCLEKYPAGLAADTHWPSRLLMTIRLRIAERLITGSTERSDAILKEIRQSKLREFQGRDPLTAAFDHRVQAHRATSDQFTVGPAFPYLARGRRLAELGREGDAEAEFSKAVELAPDDPEVLAARGVFHADFGRPDQAAADFHAALNLFTDPDKPRWIWGQFIDLEAAQRDSVFEQLTALRPDDDFLWKARAALLLRAGDLDGAGAAAERLPRLGNWPVRPEVALLRGDREEFQRLRSPLNGQGSPLEQTALLALAPTDGALTEKLLEAAQRIKKDDSYAQFWRAAASFRAGNDREAAEGLEAVLRKDQGAWLQGGAWPVLAMAYHKLGEAELSRQWLDRSERWVRWRSAETRLDPVRVFGHSPHTHDWLLATVFHREARLLIDGPDALARDDAERGARQAEHRRAFLERTKAAFERAIAAAPDDPLPRIHYARWYTERGEHDEADALYAEAAALTPNELNKFLEAGWWASTSPHGLSPLLPRQSDNFPALAAPEAAPVSFAVVRSTPYGMGQQVEFRNAPEFKDADTAYATTCVYAPEAKGVTLLVGGQPSFELRLNGRRVSESNTFRSPYHAERVPVLLRAGRNTIVARVPDPGRDQSLLLRIGDNRLDRGLELAQFGLWDEALPLLNAEFAEGRRPHEHFWNVYSALLAATGDFAAYRELYHKLLNGIGDSPPWDVCLHASEACTRAPVPETDIARLVRLVDEAAPKFSATSKRWAGDVQSRVYFRAGRYQEVLDRNQTGGWRESTLRALCWHHLGDASRAKSDLARAEREFLAIVRMGPEDPASAAVLTYGHGLLDVVGDYVLLREARTLIAPGSLPDDEALHALGTQVRQQVQAADPRLLPFELALIHNGKDPERWLQRGRARAELGEWELALADFDRAVALAPEDPKVLAARGLIHAELDRVEEAIADLRAAVAHGFRDLDQLKTEPGWPSLGSRREFQELLREIAADQPPRSAP